MDKSLKFKVFFLLLCMIVEKRIENGRDLRKLKIKWVWFLRDDDELDKVDMFNLKGLDENVFSRFVISNCFFIVWFFDFLIFLNLRFIFVNNF